MSFFQKKKAELRVFGVVLVTSILFLILNSNGAKAYYNLAAFWRDAGLSQFGVSTPAWPVVNECIPITIVAENPIGLPATTNVDLTVSLTGAGSGAFYGASDSTCSSSPITSILLPLGQTTLTVYFKDPAYEEIFLTATQGSSTGVLNTFNQAQYVVSTTTPTFQAGQCVLFTVNIEDYYGNPVTIQNWPEEVLLRQEWGNTYDSFYAGSDTTCSGSVNSWQYIPVGVSTWTFNYKDGLAESGIMNVYNTDNTFVWGWTPVTVLSPVAPENFIITGPTYFLNATCIPFTINNVDILSNYAVASTSSATTISLSSSLGGSFYGSTDSTCSGGTVTSVSLPANNSSVSFYFKDNATENPVLTASAPSFTNGVFYGHSQPTLPPMFLGRADNSMFVGVNGSLKSFGVNTAGVLGSGSWNVAFPLPQQVSGITSGATQIMGGNNVVCAVVSGSMQCWGDGETYVLDDQNSGYWNQFNTPNSPRLPGITYFGSGSRDNYVGCGAVSGGIECWGCGGGYILGNGDINGNDCQPTPAYATGIGPGSGAVQVAESNCIAVAAVAGGAQTWGYNGYGSIGTTGPSTATPIQIIPAGSGVTAVTAGDFGGCAVVSGGLQCWGIDVDAVGNIGEIEPPGSGVTAVTYGDQFICYIKNGAVYCFGDNSSGQYGDGTYNSYGRWGPEQTPGYPANVVDIAAESGSLCARFSNGDIRCSGGNYFGNMGGGYISANSVLTPIQVGNFP